MKNLKVITTNDLEEIQRLLYYLKSELNSNEDYDKYRYEIEELEDKISTLIYEIDN